VLGFLGPASFFNLKSGARSDKQIDKILSGASAVERFKAQNGNKKSTADTTPPLVKQADLFAAILNPPSAEGPRSGGSMPVKPAFSSAIKPGTVSSKFDLLGTCYSGDPKTSFAYIQLPDKTTYQWVRVGDEIGHVTIKEIRKGSIICSEGGRDAEKEVPPLVETSSLLETGKAAAMPAASQLPPAEGEKPPATSAAAAAPKSPASPVRPSVASSRAAASLNVVPSMPSAQISKEERESLSQLGNRLKAGASADSDALNPGKLITDYKASLANPPQGGTLPSPGEMNTNKSAWKESLKEESRRTWQKRLMPRPTKK